MRRGFTPYQQFGRKLGEIRQRLQETLPEVSGAVEVEADTLIRYEIGEERPSEDVLMLLINHFNITEDEADELWDLAGYNNPAHSSDDQNQPPTLVMMPFDNRIVYTDGVHVAINNFGVVMNFTQNGFNNQPASIARIGMSLDHARSVLEVLQKTIAQAEATKHPKVISAKIQKQTKKKNS